MSGSTSKQYNDYMSRSTGGNVRDGLLYFLIGGGIGAAVALLFAPKSGAELRTDITDLTKKGLDETVELAHQLKDQSAEVLESIKERTEKVYGLAAAKFFHIKDVVDDTIDTAEQKINGELLESEPFQRHSSSGRKGSNIV